MLFPLPNSILDDFQKSRGMISFFFVSSPGIHQNREGQEKARISSFLGCVACVIA
jgi:hypothetical protein